LVNLDLQDAALVAIERAAVLILVYVAEVREQSNPNPVALAQLHCATSEPSNYPRTPPFLQAVKGSGSLPNLHPVPPSPILAAKVLITVNAPSQLTYEQLAVELLILVIVAS